MGTIRARIFQPSKTSMQSGRAKTQEWMLEYMTATARRPEPLMGWVSSGDTLNQVKISFPTKEEAVAFADKKGFLYEVQEPQVRKTRPNNFAMNFRARLSA
jgi:hypothetical protein